MRPDRTAASTGLPVMYRLRGAGCLLALCCLLPVAEAGAAVDPFYARALAEGTAAFEQGDFHRASARLRIAVFGMLDEPAALTDGLLRLALAQAAAGDHGAFLETFDRVNEVEERFRSYSRGSLPASLRSAFEGQVIESVPSTTLNASATWSELARAAELRLLGALPPAQAETELRRIATENPDDPQWRSMLARAQVANGHGDSAIDALEQEVLANAGGIEASCLLGRAYLQADRCESALVRVPTCDLLALPQAEQIQYIDCLVADARWSEAAAVVVSLPADFRQTRPIAKREKRIARALPAETPNVGPAPGPPPASASAPEPQQTIRDTSPPAVRPGVPPAVIAQLRDRLDRATTAPDLVKIADDAEALATRYPTSVEPLHLAGEAAYRASSWHRAAGFLLSLGGPPENRPDLLFYLSVALYETQRPAEAATVLRRAEPNLVRTPIVERYMDRILPDHR